MSVVFDAVMLLLLIATAITVARARDLVAAVVKFGLYSLVLCLVWQHRGAPDVAITEAARARLRPILMTTATTTLALLPMALGFGEGAEVRAPMAITVIGGLVVSTLLTLLVIPVVYALLDGGARALRVARAPAEAAQ